MSERIARIRARLNEAFAPRHLELIDESHLHTGHAGAQSGRGHFRVRIVSERFAGSSQVARHRMVYSALAGLMTTDIHALGIQALTPDEAGG